MQKIVPSLWFNGNAEEAVNFYTSLFNNSKIGNITRRGPDGQVMSATFQLAGQMFMALNGGPGVAFTPALSFFVNCESEEEIHELWSRLSAEGQALMPLDKYPPNEKFGWVRDKYGLSWQLNLGARRQKIAPFFMFIMDQSGKAEEAINFYTSLFEHSEIITLERYGASEDQPLGTVKYALFTLGGFECMALDSSLEHRFAFSPGISFFVNCETQAEVDELWNKLTAVGGEPGRSGWLLDRYGISWQIIPRILGELLNDPDPVKLQRVLQAMLKMSKIEIHTLCEAYDKG